MSYTPGPWTFGTLEYAFPQTGNGVTSRPFDYRGPGFYDNPGIYGPNGEQVISCDEYMVFGPNDNAEQRAANARLIASAPELVEALETAITCALRGSVPATSTVEEWSSLLARIKGEA